MNNYSLSITSNKQKLNTHRAIFECYSITDKYINSLLLDKLGRNKNE